MNFKKEIAKSIEIKDKTTDEIENLIENIKETSFGDFSLPCFSLAKEQSKAPNIIAEEILKTLKKNKFIDKVELKGIYINFKLNKEEVYKEIYSQFLKNEENYFKIDKYKGQKIVLDYSSCNLAKFLHIGHMRNLITGMLLANIFKGVGYKVIGNNYVGDYGLPYGLLIAGVLKFGRPDKVDMEWLQNLYIKVKDLEKADEEFAKYGRECFLRLDRREPEVLKIFEEFREITFKESLPVFNEFDVTFESFNGEFYYSQFMNDIIKILNDKKLLIDSENRKVVKLKDFGLTDAVILKEDGSSVYATRDIAAVYKRKEEYGFDKLIYITGNEQNLHFKQFFKVSELAGIVNPGELIHIGHGLYRLESGKISSRLGKTALMKDIIAEAKNKAEQIIIERYNEKNEKLAKEIGLGSLIFGVANGSIAKDNVFDFEKALSFEGETAPYLMYTHARICSVLAKGGFKRNKIEDSLNFENITTEQFEIIKSFNNFNDLVLKAAENYEPSLLAKEVLNIAKNFNKFYNENKIISEDEKTTKQRLVFCYLAKLLLAHGLKLLNIEPVEKM